MRRFAICGMPSSLLKSVTRSKREYPASNAFGATVNVSEVNEDKYSIYLGKRDLRSSGPPFIQLQIKMAVDEARDAKPDLGLGFW